MSWLHPVKGRTCAACGYRWFAEQWSWAPRPTVSKGMYSAGANIAHAYQRQRYEQWRYCPRCGAKNVKTHDPKGFVPTAAEGQ